eukprot:c22826_g2_i2 orf=565-2772(+)
MQLATYISLLRRCGITRNLLEGMRLHNDIVNGGHEQDCNVGNRLVQMYGECGSLESANDVFVRMPERDIFSWTIMIKVFTENDKPGEGLQMFQQMEQEGTIANNVSFITILSGCISQAAVKEGKRLHSRIVTMAWDIDVVVSTSLINMYNKCECVDDSWKVFDKMAERNEVSWNVMITGCIRIRMCEAALELFKQMQSEGYLPTKITFVSILKADGDNLMTHFKECKRIHACISSGGTGYDVVVGTVLVNMYAKVGDIDEVRRVFEMISEPNAVSWNTMIVANLELGHGNEALKLFQQMLLEGNILDRFNLASVLAACASQDALAQGRNLHALIVGSQLVSDLIVGNSLINLYGKCGRLEDAYMLFVWMPCRDIVSYNSLLSALVQQEHNEDALKLFQQMRLEGVMPDEVSLATVLSSCAYEETFAEGVRMHAIIRAGELSSDNFLSTSLVSMYGKSSDLESAAKVLDMTDTRDVVIWTAMISSCAQHGLTERAFSLYQQMQVEGVIPNKATVTSVLDACASQTDLNEGNRIHSCILAHDMVSQVSVGNAVINMYTKCGNLKEAWNVFKEMPRRDVVTWTAIIAGHARLGHGMEAHELFQDMHNENILPNKVTFINIIDACSHAGLVDEACYYFTSISEDYGIVRTAEHYNCMVDVLGRAGRLCEGEMLILCMPFSPLALLWLTLLSACKCHMDVELANRAADRVFGLDPESIVPYALLSSIYATLGEWEEVSRL